jgi:hypothetical protein
VTCFAIGFGVCSGKFIACQIVVKFVCIKPDDLKGSAVVIAVTAETIFSGYFRRGVVSFLLVNP